MFSSILVLCIGNICRSPLAEAQLRFIVDDPSITITSAGLHAMHNYPASEHSRTIAKANNLDLSQHVAKQVSKSLLRNADLILVMTTRQLKEVLSLHPETRGKVFLLSNTPPQDIPDPYKQDMAAFTLAWELIKPALNQWANLIKNDLP